MLSDFTFSIITMNRSSDLGQTLKKLNKKIQLNQSNLIIVDNGSAINHKHVNENLSKQYGANYFYLKNNLGVSGGRNFALKKCKTRFIIEIDDDINFLSNNFINRITEHFKSARCAVVAFNIVSNVDGTSFRSEEKPFFNKKRIISMPEKCSWFIGAGHAFDLEKFNKIGFYRDFFPYGSEESDLSLRIYDNDFHIVYDPSIVIHHIKTPSARIPNRSLIAIRLAHRLKVALLNLPLLSILTYSIIRSIQFVILSKSFLIIFDAMKLILNDRAYILENRKKIKYKTFITLFKLRGHLFF